MRRTALLLALLVASTAVAALALPAAAQPPPPGPVPTIRWSPCFTDLGPVRVRHPPGAARLRPAGAHPDPDRLVRLPATSPEERIGSLLVNPGGPGGSGVEFVLSRRPVPLLRRGAGPVRPRRVRSPRHHHQQPAALLPVAGPGDPVFAARLRLPGDRRRGGDRIADDNELGWTSAIATPARSVDHMATADVARDMDRIRQALGDDQLNYAGYSYGSFLGVSYANLFPDKVGAVVVDGVLDPVAWTTGVGDEAATLPFSYRLRSDAGAQATLDEFFRLCDESPAGCAFSGDSAARFAAIADTLLQGGPVEVIDPFTGELVLFGYQDLIVGRLSGRCTARSTGRSSPPSSSTSRRRRSPAALGASAAGRVGEHRARSRSLRPTPTSSRGSSGWRARTRTTRTATLSGRRPPTTPKPASATSGGSGPGRPSPCAVWSGVDSDRYRRAVGCRHRQPGAGGGDAVRPRHQVRGRRDGARPAARTRRCSPSRGGATRRCSCRRAPTPLSPTICSPRCRLPTGRCARQDFGPFDVAALPSITSTEADARSMPPRPAPW